MSMGFKVQLQAKSNVLRVTGLGCGEPEICTNPRILMLPEKV